MSSQPPADQAGWAHLLSRVLAGALGAVATTAQVLSPADVVAGDLLIGFVRLESEHDMQATTELLHHPLILGPTMPDAVHADGWLVLDDTESVVLSVHRTDLLLVARGEPVAKSRSELAHDAGVASGLLGERPSA